MTANFKLFLVTWNVAGANPPGDLTRLLGLDQIILPDLYAIGLQELKSNTTTLISDSLFDDPWTTNISNELCMRGFVRLKSLRLVGIHLSIYVKRSRLLDVTSVESEYTRTGLGGLWGSKGGVSIRMEIAGVNLCFVNSHFSAHSENFAQRIEDYNQVLLTQKFRDINFPNILDHDYVFWLGDLNFRLDDIEYEDATNAIKEGRHEELLHLDQLTKARQKDLIFLNFEEGNIKFPPSFKFDINTDQYDTSIKRRVPAWCDRILWRVHDDAYEKVELSVEQKRYTSVDCYKESDHKPVVSEFTIKVLQKSPDHPVIFEPLSHWERKEQAVTYSIPKSFPTSSRDWIGIYPVKFRNFEDYATYTWIPTCAIDDQDDNYLCVVVFEKRDISLLESGLYKLLYFSAAKNCVVGYSEDFELLDKGQTQPVDDSVAPTARGEADIDRLYAHKISTDLHPQAHGTAEQRMEIPPEVQNHKVTSAVEDVKTEEDSHEKMRSGIAMNVVTNQQKIIQEQGDGKDAVEDEAVVSAGKAAGGRDSVQEVPDAATASNEVSDFDIPVKQRPLPEVRSAGDAELPVEEKSSVVEVPDHVHESMDFKDASHHQVEEIVKVKKESNVEAFEDSYLQLREDALAKKEDKTVDGETVVSRVEGGLESTKDSNMEFVMEVENALLRENMNDFISSLDDLDEAKDSEKITTTSVIGTSAAVGEGTSPKVEEIVVAKKKKVPTATLR